MTVARGRRLGLSLLVISFLGVAIIAASLFLWTQNTSSDHVYAQTKLFSDLMRVVRPVVLLLLLLAWRPVVTWLHLRGHLTARFHGNLIGIWSRLSIWVLLIELTIGQGYLLIGLAATAVYWLTLRLR